MKKRATGAIHGGHGGASPRMDRSPGARRPGAVVSPYRRECATLPWRFIRQAPRLVMTCARPRLERGTYRLGGRFRAGD